MEALRLNKSCPIDEDRLEILSFTTQNAESASRVQQQKKKHR